jgi:hypothetical protein
MEKYTVYMQGVPYMGSQLTPLFSQFVWVFGSPDLTATPTQCELLPE